MTTERACPDCGYTEGHTEICAGFARNDPANRVANPSTEPSTGEGGAWGTCENPRHDSKPQEWHGQHPTCIDWHPGPDRPLPPLPEPEGRHRRYYVPGWFVRAKLRRRPLCDWGFVAVTWIDGKGQRNIYECTRCDRRVTVIEPPDGLPLAYGCKTPPLWFLRRQVTPNAL